MRDNTGAMVESSVFSSFGDRMTGAHPRYGYVGAHGYQAHDEFPYHHVGARYYDASSGRFLQRDPTGISGGRNVFEYVESSPLIEVDPTGTGFWSSVVSVVGVIGIPVGIAIGVIGAIVSSPVTVGIGVAIAVVSIVINVVEVVNVHRRARKILEPLIEPLKRRDRRYGQAMDDTGYGR